MLDEARHAERWPSASWTPDELEVLDVPQTHRVRGHDPRLELVLGDAAVPLAEHDPELFELIDDVFRQNPWRYSRYDQRKTLPGGK